MFGNVLGKTLVLSIVAALARTDAAYSQETVIVVNEKQYYNEELVYESEYDKMGNKIKRLTYDDDGSIEQWSEYKYDKAGNMIGRVDYFGDSIYRRWEYEYDEAGNQKKYIVYNVDGDVCGYANHEYEYDKEGNVTNDVSDNYATGNADIERGWYYTTQYQYQYDKAGNIEKEIHYWNDDIFYWWEYEYDEAGCLLTAIEYYDDGTVKTKDEYEYEYAFTTYVYSELKMNHNREECFTNEK